MGKGTSNSHAYPYLLTMCIDGLSLQTVSSHGVQTVSACSEIPARKYEAHQNVECAKRWQQSLDPELDHSEWRDEEVHELNYLCTEFTH